ncbi:MAG TPA: hemerythrin domain-containing protein [Archangium sp.]|uniref:hemerythrin domain-containing protein n=1 Tax=Archangium sp. TaxID=1872627 RepID=UPI002E2F8DFE|nr:hemerythrin domain-containing protein [Archangium sp.]HEX5751577.1 hemerythrin domain-containing protein [Archangium sp.]
MSVAVAPPTMINRVETLKRDHGRLRVLLGVCEKASASELPGLLRQLHDVFVPHQRAKEQLYEVVVASCQDSKDATTLTLLNIFRTNLTVMSSAVLGFFSNVDTNPERLHQRFRTVAAALRSLMDTEEKSVFPLCLRQQTRMQQPARSLRIQTLSSPPWQAGGR